MNLQPQDDIAADSCFLRREMRTSLGDPSEGLLRNEHFLIVKTHPFKRGEKFELDYAKNQQRRRPLWITYDGSNDDRSYVIDYDQEKQLPRLKLLEGDPPASPTSLVRYRQTVVYAAELQDDQGTPQDRALALRDRAAIVYLKDPFSSVAAKLNAIDSLNSRDTGTLQAYLAMTSPDEPFSLTILDLEQHSDRELASMAAVLARHADVDGFIVRNLESSDRTNRQSAEKILLRIDQGHAIALLNLAGAERFEDVKQTWNQVISGQNTSVLKGTASAQGDRYYVKASWNPGDTQVVSCLTNLFNSNLLGKRTPTQEQSVMAGKSQRYVYWYGKAWSIDVSRSIKQCGATADFVHPY